jgi:hypothetical protein
LSSLRKATQIPRKAGSPGEQMGGAVIYPAGVNCHQRQICSCSLLLCVPARVSLARAGLFFARLYRGNLPGDTFSILFFHIDFSKLFVTFALLLRVKRHKNGGERGIRTPYTYLIFIHSISFFHNGFVVLNMFP